ncbi:MAG: GNAT family N-acetyltransferase [Burkholderiales bacterium]|nr:GNAT family N-acetyltransferase [Anaerolineae bacterium]
MTHLDLPDSLPADVLVQRGKLPLKPASLTLTGRFIELIPYDEARDVEALYAVSNGSATAVGNLHVEAYDSEKLIWRWMFSGPHAMLGEFVDYMRTQTAAAYGLPYTVFHREMDKQVGVANYMSNAPDHLKIELGSIWYSPLVQRTAANTEATYLMLNHAFEQGYRRLEWKCNAMNLRSRHSAERMGFKFEGIQDAHMVVKGRNRDTAWFRILSDEWPAVKTHLEALLEKMATL